MAASANPDPLARLDEAIRRSAAAQFRADYEATTVLTRQGRPHTESRRHVVTQDGPRRKVETYVRGIVLVQSVLQTPAGLLMCAYAENPDQPECLQAAAGAASGDVSLDALRYAITRGLVTLHASASTATVGEMTRTCHQFTYTMHVDQLTPDTLKGFLSAAWPQQQFEDVTPLPSSGIQMLTGAFCLDEQLGIPLTAASRLVAQSGDPAQPAPLAVETTQTLTWLTPDPLLTDADFTPPSGAEAVPARQVP